MKHNDNNKLIQGYWRSASFRAIIPYFAFAAVLIVAMVILGKEVGQHLNAIEKWISDMGFIGILVYILLVVVLTSIFIPDTLFGIIAGTLFGLGLGFIAVFTGVLIGSVLQYWLSRSLLRNRIERIIASKPNLVLIQQAVSRQELRLQFLLRLTPMNPVIISYLLGAAGVRFRGFFVACFGLLPIFFVEVYFGYAGKHIVEMASRNKISDVLHDTVFIGGFIALIIVIFIISRIARKAIDTTISQKPSAIEN
jgi:uncharacterized membrane protein YdjX (TVP38/TMEM64 family)